MRILNANCPRRRARTRHGERGGVFCKAYLTANGRPSRVLTILRMFGGIAARCGRCAQRASAYGDRADRLNPNVVFSKRVSYQRRGHATVS